MSAITGSTVRHGRNAQREQLDVLKVLSDDVSMRDGALSSLTGISIEAGEADKQARIRWSINQGERSMSFAVAAPVSDDGKPTQLASLDGLADALTCRSQYLI